VPVAVDSYEGGPDARKDAPLFVQPGFSFKGEGEVLDN